MALVRIIDNILEPKEKEFVTEEALTVEELIRGSIPDGIYSKELVECYDCETGKTFFAPIEDDSMPLNAIVGVNGHEVSNLGYRIQKSDVIEIIITPTGDNWSWGGAWIGALEGSLSGMSIGSAAGVWPWGALIGAAIGLTVGFIAGGLIGGALSSSSPGDGSNTSQNIGEALPDTRGATNQPITDNAVPLVIGKHLTTPFITGSAWNEISGYRGETNYIHALYLVGYAPLRLTEFKLGELHLAHNKKTDAYPDLLNIFHGTLSDSEIVNIWKSNDIEIEILQQGQDNENIDYGNIYPYATIQEDIKANSLYIVDESEETNDTITYKGRGLKNGLRNNPVRVTQQCPQYMRVELDFPNGLYKSRTETDDDNNSKVVYSRIPLWVAIQWRVYSIDNKASDAENHGVTEIPEFDYTKGTYKKTPDGRTIRGWNTFKRINDLDVSKYTIEERYKDIAAHTGNELKNEKPVITNHKGSTRFKTPIEDADEEYLWEHIGGWVYMDGDKDFKPSLDLKQYCSMHDIQHKTATYFWVDFDYDTTDGDYECNINKGWLDAEVFNLEELGGTNDDEKGLNEIRCIAEESLYDWATTNLRKSGDSQSDFVNKFKSYFLDVSNTMRAIEVRVIRVSPCYLDETVSTSKASAYKFTDVFTWNTLTSRMYDMNELLNNGNFIVKRPQNEELMRRGCYVALKAKSDNTDQLSNMLPNFSCIAESFAPYYDPATRKWLPENVSATKKYYNPDGEEITEAQYISDRQAGIKSKEYPAGNDFIRQMMRIVRTTKDSRGRYYIPNDSPALKYCTNNVASMFLYAGIGPHLGIDALEYRQSGFESGVGNFNMVALSRWHEWSKDVTDGSKYPDDGYHFDSDGNPVYHEENEVVHISFTANGYITQSEMLENLLSELAIAGRSVYTKDKKGRFTVIIDKKEAYPSGVINQQNTIQSSYSISYQELPSGLQISYQDENDGYNQLNLYCMVDGENANSPKGSIEPYSIKFVTNNHQAWSLGRYLLANRILNREVVTKKIGMEGYSLALGNIVILQDDLMLIGTDTGGRITRIIETDSTIYGFIINNTFEYTGETETYSIAQNQTGIRCKQGVLVMQPAQRNEARCITLRLATSDIVRVVNGVSYQMERGNTNLVLFEKGISKSSPASDVVYKPEVDNIVGFGIIGQESSKYRIIRIKQDSQHHFELSLAKYQEDLYEYGARLPSFQNNMTLPDRSKEDAFALSNNVTYADMMKALAESANIAQGKIDTTFGQKPQTPKNLKAEVQEDLIQLSCTMDSDEVNIVDHIEYEIMKPDGTTVTVIGSYKNNYYYDRSTDGYPEADELAEWQFRARAVSFYLDSNGEQIAGDWTEYAFPTEDSLDAYGTWIPAAPSVTGFIAEENGINCTWQSDNSRMYGTVSYYMTTAYNGMERGTVQTPLTGATYQFDRNIDGYPEKPDTPGAAAKTLSLDKYTVQILAINNASKKQAASTIARCDYSKYKTWIPGKPSISPRVVNRNITLYLSQDTDCYGNIMYLVGIRRYDDPIDVFYYPDLVTNPYSRETAYKTYEDGLFVIGKIESESQYSQTVPLEVQNGTMAMLDVDEDEDSTKILTVPVENKSDYKILRISKKGIAPMDTAYQFEVYSFNKTTQWLVDNISMEGNTRQAIALATSVQDVLNSSIVTDKIGTSAVENDKIASNAVTADKIFTYNLVSLTNGTHAISGFAPNSTTDTDYFEYLERVKSNSEDVAVKDGIDDYIKRHALSYWIGLDSDHPEFWMGNVFRSEKEQEGANYFHYYYDKNSDSTNLDLQLTNFILKALSSTIKGFFNVRDRAGNYIGANSFLCVNPETEQNEGIPVPPETLTIKGDVFIQQSNSGKSEGTLTVSGLTSLFDAIVSGSVTITNTNDIDLTGESYPALMVGGNMNSQHIEIDGNEIMAKLNGTTPNTLFLNAEGGDVEVGTGTLIANGKVELKQSGSSVFGTGVGTSWFNGRDGARLKVTSCSNTDSFFPIMSSKTRSASWECGVLNEDFFFSYIKDSDYTKSVNNRTSFIQIKPASSGKATITANLDGNATTATTAGDLSKSSGSITAKSSKDGKTYTVTLNDGAGNMSGIQTLSVTNRVTCGGLNLKSISDPIDGDIWIE